MSFSLLGCFSSPYHCKFACIGLDLADFIEPGPNWLLRRGVSPPFKRFQCFALFIKLSLQNISFFSISEVNGAISINIEK